MLYIGAFCTHKNKIETLWKTLRLHFHLFFFHWSWQARIQMYIYQYDSQTTKMQQTDVNEMGINANRQYFLLVFVFSQNLFSFTLNCRWKCKCCAQNLFEYKKFTSIKISSKFALNVILCSVSKIVEVFFPSFFSLFFLFKF